MEEKSFQKEQYENVHDIKLDTNKVEEQIPIYSIDSSTEVTSYCVGMVDMVESTKLSAHLGIGKLSRYYQVFLNSLSDTINRHGGRVIKNMGDCLIYYFPESSKVDRIFGFICCLESAVAMIEEREKICHVLTKEGLPCVDYRISMDYGPVVLMRSNGSPDPDLLGPPVNMCCKINRIAPANGAVLGGDLYQVVKNVNGYRFKQAVPYSLGFKLSYPVYLVDRSK